MITSRPLGSTAYIDYTLIHPGTGAAYTVASTDDITVRIFDSTSGTPMAGSVKTYARDTGNPGSYYAVVPVSTSTFTIGAVYNVVVQVTLAGIDSKGVIETFVVQPPALIGTVATGTGTASSTTFKSNVELPETPSTIFTGVGDVRLWLRSSDEVVRGALPTEFLSSKMLSWHRADLGLTTDPTYVNNVTDWDDQGGGGRDFNQGTTAYQPLTGGVLGGQAALRFHASAYNFMSLVGTSYGSPSALHVIRVFRVNVDPPAAGGYTGLDKWGPVGDNCGFPWTNGTIYDATATNPSYATVGNPSDSMAEACVYESIATASKFDARLNGTVIYNGATEGVSVLATPIIGGTGGGTSRYLDGLLAEVIALNAEMSSAEREYFNAYVRERYGLVLDGTAVDTVATVGDRTSYGHDANQTTFANRPTLTAGVIDFDHAGSQRLVITHTGNLNTVNSMTLGVRVRIDRTSTTEGIITKSSSGGGSWSVQNASGELRFWIGTPGVNGGYLAGLAAGTTYTMVWVYDGSQTGNANRLKLWLNGVAQTLSFYGTIPATITSGTDNILLGTWADSVQHFNGAMAEVVLTSPAATTDQVARLSTLLTSRGTDHWKDCLITFTSGALAGQVQKVTEYDGDSTYFTVGSAFSAAPAVGDKFLILNH